MLRRRWSASIALAIAACTCYTSRSAADASPSARAALTTDDRLILFTMVFLSGGTLAAIANWASAGEVMQPRALRQVQEGGQRARPFQKVTP